ncbi:MAG TPA: Rap1a/Tai family immunity protein [Thermodesulfovibrionales bacterium]|nr:Rap1a/Tai family immunity protein [Thermodesulfovibrionales bacterium]
MKRRAIGFFLSVLLMLPAVVGAVSEKEFEVRTTRDLINICSAAPDDPLHTQAVNFCEGYLVGAFHYYQASTVGPKASKLICLPDPQPSRNDTVKMFIEWAKAHPQYEKDLPVETEFRFLIEKWPCKP